MDRYIALLRGINVGGHRVRMTELASLFEGLGLRAVETFIASGNVIFDTPPVGRAELRARIEERLREALGYNVRRC